MTDCLANWVNERITDWLNEWMTDKLCVVVQQKCKALSNISQSKSLWFLQLAATLAHFLFCGVARWGMWGVCVCVVCGVYDEPACHVCISGHALQSNMAHANSQTNQTGWFWSHRFLCRTPDVAANDKCRQSTLIQTVTSYIAHIPHLPHTSPHTPSSLPPSVNQLSVLSNLPAACLQPSNYSAQPFGSSPLICPTLPSMHACNPAYPDNWWAASTTLCAFHFSLYSLSLCLCFLRFCLKGAKSLGMQRPKESRVSLDPVSLLCGLFGSVSFTFVQFRFVHL